MFTAALLTIAKCWTQPKYPSVNEWIKTYGTFTQWNTTQQKEGGPIFRNSMGGTGEHYAKWNKPEGKKQIPYDLTYKRNWMNKTNKGAK